MSSAVRRQIRRDVEDVDAATMWEESLKRGDDDDIAAARMAVKTRRPRRAGPDIEPDLVGRSY